MVIITLVMVVVIHMEETAMVVAVVEDEGVDEGVAEVDHTVVNLVAGAAVMIVSLMCTCYLLLH